MERQIEPISSSMVERQASMPAIEQDSGKLFQNAAVAIGVGFLGAAALKGQTSPVSDVDLLNYALTLEHLEAAFYNQGLRQFSSLDIGRAGVTQNLGEVPTGSLYAYLTLIRAHENAHVRYLQRTLRSFAITPVEPCGNYTFDFSSVDTFLTTARTLENAGVTAYVGALGLIRSPQLREAAATIATVEARHAAFLNVLNGDLAAPDAFDKAATRAEILELAAPFLASCNV